MKRNHTRTITWLAGLIGAALVAAPAFAQAPETTVWDGYLDFAYV